MYCIHRFMEYSFCFMGICHGNHLVMSFFCGSKRWRFYIDPVDPLDPELSPQPRCLGLSQYRVDPVDP